MTPTQKNNLALTGAWVWTIGVAGVFQGLGPIATGPIFFVLGATGVAAFATAAVATFLTLTDWLDR